MNNLKCDDERNTFFSFMFNVFMPCVGGGNTNHMHLKGGTNCGRRKILCLKCPSTRGAKDVHSYITRLQTFC